MCVYVKRLYLLFHKSYAAERKLFYPFMTPNDSCNDTLSVPILGSSSCTALTILIDPQNLSPSFLCVSLFPLILPRNISNVTSILIVLTIKSPVLTLISTTLLPKISIDRPIDRFYRTITFFAQNNRWDEWKISKNLKSPTKLSPLPTRIDQNSL